MMLSNDFRITFYLKKEFCLNEEFCVDEEFCLNKESCLNKEFTRAIKDSIDKLERLHYLHNLNAYEQHRAMIEKNMRKMKKMKKKFERSYECSSYEIEEMYAKLIVDWECRYLRAQQLETRALALAIKNNDIVFVRDTKTRRVIDQCNKFVKKLSIT